ncbi:MAG: aldehyde dehydrogenase family protein, partial [Mesorhizobium sp.]
AREAFRNSGWPQLPPSERADYLRRLAAAIDDRAEQLGAVVTAQIGMPLAASVQSNGDGTSKYYRYYAELADQLEVESERIGHGLRTIIRREPVGVAALIVPWNGPQG